MDLHGVPIKSKLISVNRSASVHAPLFMYMFVCTHTHVEREEKPEAAYSIRFYVAVYIDMIMVKLNDLKNVSPSIGFHEMNGMMRRIK